MEADQVKSIVYSGGPGSIKPSQPSAGSMKEVFNNWNRGGCGLTDQARFVLKSDTSIAQLAIWYQWQEGESQVAYELLKGDERLWSGAFTRGGCDADQPQWCQGVDRPGRILGRGVYTVKMARARVCRNAGSRNNGFVAVSAGGGSQVQAGSQAGALTPTPEKKEDTRLSGKGETNWGVLTIRHMGDRIEATYDEANGNGRIMASRVAPNVFVGRWVEDKAKHRCPTAFDGRNYWGVVRQDFTPDDKFIGEWDYCGTKAGGARWTAKKTE